MASVAYVSVFRQPRYYGSLGRFAVFVDGQQVGKVANGAQAQFEVSPGQHELSVKAGLRKTQPVRFTVAPGQTVRFKLESIPSLIQMLLSFYYMFAGKNYWLTEETA